MVCVSGVVELSLGGLVDFILVFHVVVVVFLGGGSHHHDGSFANDGENEEGSDSKGHGKPGEYFEESLVGRVVEVLRDGSGVLVPEGAGLVGWKLDVYHGLDAEHEVDQSDVE